MSAGVVIISCWCNFTQFGTARALIFHSRFLITVCIYSLLVSDSHLVYVFVVVLLHMCMSCACGFLSSLATLQVVQYSPTNIRKIEHSSSSAVNSVVYT